MKRFEIDDMVEAIDRFGVTHFPVVPPLLRALTLKAKGVDHGSCSLKSLKQVSCGAAATSQLLIDDFVKTFPHVDFIQVPKLASFIFYFFNHLSLPSKLC